MKEKENGKGKKKKKKEKEKENKFFLLFGMERNFLKKIKSKKISIHPPTKKILKNKRKNFSRNCENRKNYNLFSLTFFNFTSI